MLPTEVWQLRFEGGHWTVVSGNEELSERFRSEGVEGEGSDVLGLILEFYLRKGVNEMIQ